MSYVVDQLVGEPSRNVRVICVNGILTWPGDAEGWTDRAVTWLNVRTDAKAEKFEYASDILTRRLFQQWRAEAIAKMAGYYIAKGCEVVFIGHSNAGDLIERVLALLKPAKIRSAHLFAPACDGGELSRALAAGQLGTLYLYGSANDHALLLAHWSEKLFGWTGLGYGDLGRRVWEFAFVQQAGRVVPTQDDAQSHGSWFERGEAFERTMRMIVAKEFGGEAAVRGAPFDESFPQ